ncbi:MAG: hypothetical protein A2787_01995 [Omnitrophica WOR_2 bacterium RIFCSPHIGHO2_01_FULL_48_9]|nr:MAG: hypothetical protein A3D10_05270 [Omnitrophica WOR_2 bacterium RIFCSPHIGHO2_02_FULL_48_11]OGX34391.1 MAG: hypothetical protein A2787_01995 [Omnitrophica WOR_2 bacterium RIFCSPHIGHO2_01_FULL_48_9]
MLKAIIFDFDGVICESVDVKIQAFRKLFEIYPKHLKQILAYHAFNGGLSRYKKFRYIYRHFLKKELRSVESLRLGQKFSEYALAAVIQSAYVPGAHEFLKKYYKKFHLFIVSGTPQPEMRFIVKKRKLTKYFKGVYGSPTAKAVLIRQILKKNRLQKDEVIFVGDSVNDHIGAAKAGVKFIGRVRAGQKNPFKGSVGVEKIIPDVSRLPALVKKHSFSSKNASAIMS